MKRHVAALLILVAACFTGTAAGTSGTDRAAEWPQFKFDSLHSGNAADREPGERLGLVKAVPLTDAVFTSPAVAGGRVFVVDGAGVAFCFDAASLDLLWKVPTRGGGFNCNNISSPAVTGGFVHFGTTAGYYYVLDAANGEVVKEIALGEPVFSAPVINEKGVFFVTLGSRVHALAPDGTLRWTWDFVKECLEFDGDRWSGEAWCRRESRVTWRDQFCCSRNVALHHDTLVIPAGGSIVWLRDAGDRAELEAVHAPKESPSTLGLSLDETGAAYRQWYRRDNTGRVEILRLEDGAVKNDFVRGTDTSYTGQASMSFSSVSVRDGVVYRCRPEQGRGLCRHAPGEADRVLHPAFSLTAPVLTARSALFGSLDGCLHIVPLSGKGEARSFRTAFGKPITAPVAVSGKRVYFGCEDGYLYVLGPEGKAGLPKKELGLSTIRTALTGRYADPAHDWFTNFGNYQNTNANDQGVKPPFALKWIRRFEGTVKHFSVCGGGRLYTHTAEGQIFAVEQETGRLLWRTAFPDVHVSYTAPLYREGRLYVPQAGLEKSRLRCLDAATGALIWEAPFTGSPSWNRQQPPIVHEGLVFYLFSTGRYTAKGWLFEHQKTFSFPEEQKPLLRAWDRETGREAWTIDFSEFGSGGDDAGFCLMDGTLYYSCYFGRKKPPGVTAAVEPATGRVLWKNTDFAVHAGCAVSGSDGKLYLGGYNAVEGKTNRIFCLDARTGSLVWKSDPVERAIHVVTVRDRTLFTHAQYGKSYLLDRETGKIVQSMEKGYRCTRFTVSEPYLLGANCDTYDLENDLTLVATGPAVDVLICVGAHVSNGRLFFTANGGGLQLSMACGDEAVRLKKSR